MGERLSRLAPTIMVGVAALLLAACGDADTGNVPSVSPSPSPRTTVVTTVTTPAPVLTPTGEPSPVLTRQAIPQTLQTRSATPLATAAASPATAPPLTASPVATPAPTAPPPPITTTPTAIVPPPGARASVGRVATAENVDGLQRPVGETSTFEPTQRVYIAVEFIDVQTGAELGFSWQADGGCAGSYTLPPRSALRRGFFGFFIDETECIGRYVVEILVDGVAHAETTFAVGAAQPIG